MIPVRKVKEPKDFDSEVRIPGNLWRRSNPNAERPKSLWDPFKKDLEKGFGRLCGYAAMLDPTGGTVDHYLSYKNHRSLTYEWSNYRFASAVLNSSKKNADDSVLDPYEVGEGWFEIILPSLQMRVTDIVPAAHREKAEFTLKRLKLRDGENIIRWRQNWYNAYLSGILTLDGLHEFAPLIAKAVEKQLATP